MSTKPQLPPVSVSRILEYSLALCAVFVLASVCWGLLPLTGYLFSALVFLVAIVLAGLRWSRGPVLMMAVLCALVWNFLFIPPQFTLHIEKPQDAVMFALFFLAALSMGHLTSRLHEREQNEARQQRQTDALLRVAQCSVQAPGASAGLDESLRVIRQITNAERVSLVLSEDGALNSSPEQDRPAMEWCHTHRTPAGRFTEQFPDAHATWFLLGTEQRPLGVIGFHWPRGAEMDPHARQLIESLALQLSLVIGKEKLIAAARRADLLAESERLQRALLDSVSHELKTPIAVIRTALDGLGGSDPWSGEIRTAVMRLQRIVESFLEMTRMESGVLTAQKDWCDLDDVLQSAQESLPEELKLHPLRTDAADMPLLKLDGRLLAQALTNVLHNATIYAPPGTPIELCARVEEGSLILRVRDHGPGLPDGGEERVFDKFYRAPASPSGGTGLGLAIARGFLRAQGGDLTARSHPDGGAEFTFTIPAETHPV